MSRIYGAASGELELALYCTPPAVVKEARKCTKNGEKLLVVTSSFNGIEYEGAHCRLVIIYRDTSYKMVIYDPFVPLEVSPGTIEKLIAKKLNIRCAEIASGTQKPLERNCVMNSIEKAAEIMDGKDELKIVKKYDFVSKKYV